MLRLLLVNFVVLLWCSSILADDLSKVYPANNTQDCAFPFTYRDNEYDSCTVDGDNGDIPWCSMTQEYKGLITYCVDFRNTTIQCLPSFTMPDGKTYTSCAILSSIAKYKQCKTNSATTKYRYCTDALESPKIPSLKRHDDCDPAYAKLAQDHTLCYGPSPYANVVPLTDSEKQGLLDLHNKKRAEVTSQAMYKLAWNDELAKLAQAHANLCVFEHDQAANRVSPKFGWLHGQNLVMSSEIRSTPASLFDLMLTAEKGRFTYGQPCAEYDASCLHYTQAMINTTTHVGCGQTHCVYPDRIERYVTCNYLFSQYEDNYQTPYIPSDVAGSSCPNSVKDGLCDCGDVICRYDLNEYLDPGTCTCKKPVSKRSEEELDVNAQELLDNTPPPVLKVPEVEGIEDLPDSSETPEKRSLTINLKNGQPTVSKRTLTINLKDAQPELSKRDVNAEELEKYETRQLKIPMGGTVSRSMEKRTIRHVQAANRKKRHFSSIFKV